MRVARTHGAPWHSQHLEQVGRRGGLVVLNAETFSAPPHVVGCLMRKPREKALLQAWGYPHVLDQFRFHLCLTGSLRAVEPPYVDALFTGAVRQFGGLPPARFDALDLFVETAPGAPFRWRCRHHLVS